MLPTTFSTEIPEELSYEVAWFLDRLPWLDPEPERTLALAEAPEHEFRGAGT